MCAVHPTLEAVEVCSRCGSYVCTRCLELEDDAPYCESCFRKVSLKAPHGGRATAAIVCGILGMNACFPLSIAAILLGHMELAAIARGESPASGRNLAKGAMILGYVTLALSALVLLAVVVFVLAT